MAQTIALVTGANKGIGREISRQLAAKGVLVLMGARDRERGEKAVADLRAQKLPVELIQIDVTSQESVDRAAAEVERRHGRLDILVNNAGVALDWLPPSQLTVDALSEDVRNECFWRLSGRRKPCSRCSRNPSTVESSTFRAGSAH